MSFSNFKSYVTSSSPTLWQIFFSKVWFFDEAAQWWWELMLSCSLLYKCHFTKFFIQILVTYMGIISLKVRGFKRAQCFCSVMRFILSCKNNVSPNIWRNWLLFNDNLIKSIEWKSSLIIYTEKRSCELSALLQKFVVQVCGHRNLSCKLVFPWLWLRPLLF